MLWKNAFVVAVLFCAAYFTLVATCKDQEERRHYSWLFAVCLVNLTALFIPLPYFAGAALLFFSFLLLTWAGLPVIASAICLTAITPMLDYTIGGVGGINTLLNLSSVSIIGYASVVSWIVFPKAFIRRRWTALDWTVVIFAALLTILYSRGTPLTNVLSGLFETCFLLPVFYFLASRGRTGSPMFVLRCFMLPAATLGVLAIFESTMGWLQFTSAAELRGAIYPYLGSPYAVQRYGVVRATLTFSDSIACSIYLSITAICGIALYLGDKRNRLIWAAVTLILTVGTLATFARTGVLVITVGLVVFVFLARRYVYAALFAVIGIFLSLAIATSNSVETVGSITYRQKLLELVPLIAQKNVFLGDNVLPFQGNDLDLVQGQGIIDLVNTYLYLFVNGGLLLVGLFIAILVLAAKQIGGLKNTRGTSDLALYRKSALAICVALYVGLAFTSPTDKNLMYVMFSAGLLRGISVHAGPPKRRPRPVPQYRDDPALT